MRAPNNDEDPFNKFLGILDMSKMIKIHSFRATTSELLRSSFAGSISQQPAPISIYPDMDRMMHIGWPDFGTSGHSPELPPKTEILNEHS